MPRSGLIAVDAGARRAKSSIAGTPAELAIAIVANQLGDRRPGWRVLLADSDHELRGRAASEAGVSVAAAELLFDAWRSHIGLDAGVASLALAASELLASPKFPLRG